METIQIIRREEAWHKRFEISPFHEKRWFANDIINAWNDTFNIGYFDFRRLLRELADFNRFEVGFDKIINSYEITEEFVPGMGVPCDEDDWFHPDLIEVLQSKFASNPNRYYRWHVIKFDPGRIFVVKEPFDNHIVQCNWDTNNYAIVNIDKGLLAHVDANSKLKNKGLDIYIPVCLSMYNQNISSLSLYYPYRNNLRERLLQLYEGFGKEPPKNKEVPSYFLRYVDQMLDIYRKKLKLKIHYLR